jgi:hypothetical protein
LLKADKDVRKHLSEAELKANFDLDASPAGTSTPSSSACSARRA